MVNEPVIYAHRGIWSSIEEQNSSSSFESAAENGFGIETDFRSFKSKLVISHDPLSKSNFLDFDMNLFSGIPVAMNIKEDGLGELYKEFLFENSSDFSFVFDGSIPEMQKIRKKGIPHALTGG
jgi:glycerophosphoryl diester phosphodiesterase